MADQVNVSNPGTTTHERIVTSDDSGVGAAGWVFLIIALVILGWIVFARGLNQNATPAPESNTQNNTTVNPAPTTPAPNTETQPQPTQ